MSKAIYVKTTDTCNLHCDHCFTNGRNGGKLKWDRQATQAWVDDFMQRYPEEPVALIFHGGEPMLADMDDLEAFRDHYIDNPLCYLTISTNLVYKLTERRLAFLKSLGSVGTSWDVDTRFETDTQYQLFLRNHALLKSQDVSTCVFVTINQALIEQDVDSFLDRMQELGPDRIRLERLTLDGNAERNPAIFPDNETQDWWFVQVYKRYKARQHELSFRIVTLDLIEDKLNTQVVKTDTNCRNCEQNLVTMNADGSLAGCPNSAASRSHAHRDAGVDAFLSSQGRTEEIVHELDFHPNCLQCDVFHLCGGDCHKLPWQGERCGGLKHLLRYISRGSTATLIPTLTLSE